MSLIKKTDVKNHLSARHRTEIHLQPAIEADSTGFPYEEAAGPDPAENNSNESPPRSFPSGEQKAAAMATPKSVRD